MKKLSDAKTIKLSIKPGGFSKAGVPDGTYHLIPADVAAAHDAKFEAYEVLEKGVRTFMGKILTIIRMNEQDCNAEPDTDDYGLWAALKTLDALDKEGEKEGK